MSVYVDQVTEYTPSAISDPQTRRDGLKWSHLFADTSEELHAFAERLGLKRAWFQDKRFSHYDIVPTKRNKAIEMGAIVTTTREWIRRKS